MQMAHRQLLRQIAALKRGDGDKVIGDKPVLIKVVRNVLHIFDADKRI